MKLSNWAKQQGISYMTAFRWFKAGKIPYAVQYDTGTIIVNEPPEETVVGVCKAYVSQEKDEELLKDNFLVVSSIFAEKMFGLGESKKKVEAIKRIIDGTK